ncbi:MAG: MBL fold metallo-hydrolase, partial [Geminicoccaceae bacterium]
LGELGLIDVLLVPVDGSYTMAQELMAKVVEQIQAPLVIPMHYFNAATLGRFVKLVEARYEAVFSQVPGVTLSRPTLPYRKLLVLPGG